MIGKFLCWLGLHKITAGPREQKLSPWTVMCARCGICPWEKEAFKESPPTKEELLMMSEARARMAAVRQK